MKCNTKETVNHFLSECPKYDKIWRNSVLRRKRSRTGLGVFLNLDRPPTVKQDISLIISKCLLSRKRRPKTINSKQIARKKIKEKTIINSSYNEL